MELIYQPSREVLRVTGRQVYRKNREYRVTTCCVFKEIEDGLLIHHTLTGEILKLDQNERPQICDKNSRLFPQLVSDWFLVPEEFDESTFVYLTRQNLRRNTVRTGDHFNLFTIFTTTCCNARCFYCYEAGSIKKTMNENMAQEVSRYIRNHSSGKVQLKWFGGEPLCNPAAIHKICSDLSEHGIDFFSTMLTNGFLAGRFSEEMWIGLWRVRRAQITLDGVGEVYNRVKNYSKVCGNPYEQVLKNIEYLSNIGVSVNIRVTLTGNNYEELKYLIAQLRERFGGTENIRVYPAILYEGCGASEVHFTEEERNVIHRQYICLHKLIRESGLGRRYKKPVEIMAKHCMADNGKSIVILPDGNLSFCEHHYDDEICGSIHDERLDYGMLESYLLTRQEKEECKKCFYLPQCMLLEKCEIDPVCCEGYIEERKYLTDVRLDDVYRETRKGRGRGSEKSNRSSTKSNWI